MKQVGRMMMIGVVACAITSHASGESIGSRIGEVAEALLVSAVTNASGSTKALKAAYSWNEAILSTNIQMGTDRAVTYQAEGSNGYDMVRVVFSNKGRRVETKQTAGVWMVVLSNQQTQGKDDAALASMMTALAREYIEGFSNRSFVYDGTYVGGKIFKLVVEPGHESKNWLDYFSAITDGTTVYLSCVKEEPPDRSPRSGCNATPWGNKSWFFSADAGRKGP